MLTLSNSIVLYMSVFVNVFYLSRLSVKLYCRYVRVICEIDRYMNVEGFFCEILCSAAGCGLI